MITVSPHSAYQSAAHTTSQTDLDNKCSAVAEMGDRLATIDMGRKLGGGCVTWVEPYSHTKWHLNPSSRLTTTDMGRKLGAMPLLGGAGFPSNTKWPGPRPTSTPIVILIHATVWPQYTNVINRQTGQDNGVIA